MHIIKQSGKRCIEIKYVLNLKDWKSGWNTTIADLNTIPGSAEDVAHYGRRLSSLTFFFIIVFV